MQFPAEERRTYPHKLGLQGWVYAGKYRIERYLYTLHRLTGLGILLYLVLHIHVTGFKIRGPDAWKAVMDAVGAPIFHLGEYALFAAVVFHAANGIRLILTQFGFLLGKPMRPIYPYSLAMMRQRPVMILLMVLTVIVVIYGGIEFFALK
jgi:succinate dehydrogenase / fumarate reductase cytochrome b subunit